MKQVMDVYKRTDAEKRIPVLRLEIDYELATLYEALSTENEEQIKKSKEKLERYRREMIRLEA
ncbi:hypothetical protein [Bacillus solimangrovi]|uniref:Uncharacterized protein n=1 Tax=Bacillus solimangrovi TaxID=1305675 RepID=A0A1E5LIL7_9BACI|nr:hypothetical protein [Bacillus solimangrovi]OEH93898.1 hypothetical protein BFG57_10525 [Bacillus solimangrovi]